MLNHLGLLFVGKYPRSLCDFPVLLPPNSDPRGTLFSKATGFLSFYVFGLTHQQERADAAGSTAVTGCRPNSRTFMKGDSVPSKVLVLLGDPDWELYGTTAESIEDGDIVVFISTLHGI
jgi:hypothetical protein